MEFGDFVTRNKPRLAWKRALLSGAMTSLIAFAPMASAQTASEITPETLQPPLQRLNGAIGFTGLAGTEAPAGADQIGITLSGVNLENALPQMAVANAEFEARLTRGRIPVSELFDATADLEAAYANAGFVLARVVLPQQTLNDGGTLRITVVNGFVEKIDTTSVAENALARVRGLTESLVGKPSITREELERQLLLAGDVPGVALRSALSAGETQGGAIIGLDPEYKPYTGFFGISNPSSAALGTINLNAGIEINSPLKFGETLYVRLSGAPTDLFSADPVSRVIAVGAVVPIGYTGLTVNVEATKSDTTPIDADIPTRSDFDRQSIRLAYPLKRTREINLTLQAMLDLQQDSQALTSGAQIYRDALSVLRFAASGSKIHSDGAVTDGGFVLSRGLDAFGARTQADTLTGPPLSRAGIDATFTKLTGSASHQRALSDQLAFKVSGRFQTSFGDPLATSEQFSIVGAQELSAFNSGAMRGDSGWVARAELSTSRQMSISQTPVIVSPYAFASFGKVFLENPTVVEKASTEASSYGVGFDLFAITNSNFRSTSVRVEFGRGARNDGLPNENRINITGNLRF